MNTQEIPKCQHCGKELKKWDPPDDSTWIIFQWVCFNDECPYFVRGWDHMMKTQNIKASYRFRLDPETGKGGPLLCWFYNAHKAQITED